MNIALIGGGFIGTILADVLKEKFKVTLCDIVKPALNVGVNIITTDITDLNSVKTTIEQLQPDYCINTAAYTDVDGCERDPEKAHLINCKGAQYVAQICSQINIPLIHFSTDFIFDSPGLHSPDDKPLPNCVYGQSKLDGEKLVLETYPQASILRLSVPYDWYNPKHNFVTWVISELQDNKEINIVIDQIITPTYVQDICAAVNNIIEKKIQGIFHVASPQPINRFDMAIAIAKTFDLDTDLIHPITSDQLHLLAKRPFDSTLDVTSTQKALQLNFSSLEEGLIHMKHRGNSQ